MPRYFIEVAYRGTNYSGFQIQQNANTVQSEMEKAFAVIHRNPVSLTGSSRTDAGVHARQNFFHFDYELALNPQFVYKMNALLPDDIAVKNIWLMPEGAHSRFDAVNREYVYRIHRFKNPFLRGTSFFFPYKLDFEKMNEAAAIIKEQTNFFAFSKTNTQVKNFNCTISNSCWSMQGDQLSYTIEGNRFLRGMVRLLTASQLTVGRHKLSLEEFRAFFLEDAKCGFSTPAQGLFLNRVGYPENYFPATGLPFTAF